MQRIVFLLALASAAVASFSPQYAAARYLFSARDRDLFLTIVGAEWGNTRLPELPYNLVTGNISFEDAYLVSAGLSKVVVSDFGIRVPFTELRFIGNSVELQGQ